MSVALGRSLEVRGSKVLPGDLSSLDRPEQEHRGGSRRCWEVAGRRAQSWEGPRLSRSAERFGLPAAGTVWSGV